MHKEQISTGIRIQVVFLTFLLCGCAATPVVNDSATSTITSSPTLHILPESTPSTTNTSSFTEVSTASPAVTITPGFTRTNSSEIPLPTLALPTQTVTDVPQPAASTGAIQFYKPGPMSMVISPVSFYGYAVPGYDHKGLIELFGEDGSLLNSEVLQLNTAYKWAFFSWSLPFSVRGAGELGRLSLSTRDQYGRLTAIRSVPLILLAEGYAILTPSEAMVERVVLDFPPAGKRISGGRVEINGEMRPYNNQPIAMELITADGMVVGSQLVPIPPGKAGEYFLFRVDIPYFIRDSTSVLLTIKQEDDTVPGIMYLYSQEILLSP